MASAKSFRVFEPPALAPVAPEPQPVVTPVPPKPQPVISPQHRIEVARYIGWKLIVRHKTAQANVSRTDTCISKQRQLIKHYDGLSKWDDLDTSSRAKAAETARKKEREMPKQEVFLKEYQYVLKSVDRKLDLKIVKYARTTCPLITTAMCVKLPRELRDMIYRYFFDENEPGKHPWHWADIFEDMIGRQVFAEMELVCHAIQARALAKARSDERKRRWRIWKELRRLGT